MTINFGTLTGKQILQYLVWAILIGYIIFLRQCSHQTVLPLTKVKDSVSYIHDTISIPSQPQTPQISYVDTGTTKTYPVYVQQKLTRQDTEQIVSVCSKPYFYTQNFTDTKYKAHFSTVVEYDSLFNPQLTVQWLAPIESINNATATSSAQNLKLFLGFHIGASPGQFNFGPEITLLTKSDHLYGISNDLALKQPNVELHVAWKLHL